MTLKNLFKVAMATQFIFLLFFSHLSAQDQKDPFGLRGKIFTIQTAMEAGKTLKGFWDLPGKNKFKSRDNIQAWEMDKKPIGKDRYFTFAPSNTPGKYFIQFPYKPRQTVSSLSDGNVVSNFASGSLVTLKYLGNSRFKIIDANTGMVYCLAQRSSKNGTNIHIFKDHSGLSTQWVFWEKGKRQSFLPKRMNSNNPGNDQKPTITLEQAIESKNSVKQKYFANVSASQFIKENQDNKMKTFYDEQDPMTQWNHIIVTIDSTKKNNDIMAKRAVYKSLAEVTVKKGKNFAEKIFQSKIKEKFIRSAKADKDPICKRYLLNIADQL